MNLKKIKVDKSSGPLEYEYLTFELHQDDGPIIAINQEFGINNLEAEVFGVYHGYGSGVKVSLDDLINTLIEVRDYIIAQQASSQS